MRETYEFRVDADFSSRLFGHDECKDIGSQIVHLVEVASDDPRLSKIGEMQRLIKEEFNRSFFYGWHIKRQYSKHEIENANLLSLWILSVFEPAGEMCGTQYDEVTACPECGSGAIQTSDLRLDLRKAPRGKEIACTIADEVVVSQRLAELMLDAGLTGFELRPVRHKARYEDDPLDLHKVPAGREILRKAEAENFPHPTGEFYVWLNRAENHDLLIKAQAEYVSLRNKKMNKGKPLPVWYQFIPTSAEAEIVPPTRIGINPFDEDPKGEYRCSRGDLIGLNLLSEVSIAKASYNGADVTASCQFIGVRRGLLRPRRIILISPKMYRLLESENVKGVKTEIVHII